MVITGLNDSWQFSQAGLEEWLPAIVPGTVHTDLMMNGVIEDPFYRTNEHDQQWIDKVEWKYRTSFEMDPEIIEHDAVELFFHGLDTYACVFLNGHLLLEADNMFRTWHVNIKEVIISGENELEIHFKSPVRKGLSEQGAYGLRLMAVNDQSENGGLGPNKISVFTRKAGYHYGWDWGPRFVTSGIWRSVEMHAWNQLRIDNVYLKQSSVSHEIAVLEAIVNLTSLCEQTVDVIVDNFSDQIIVACQIKNIEKGKQQVVLSFSIENPRLWWCNGHGRPELYNFGIIIVLADGTKHYKEVRTGLRQVKLVREPDQYGESFYFELNGTNIFAKGSNYIPNDIFLPRVSEKDYRKVITDAASANMNMIRVWGGGIYENDIFYNLCDEMGIMVWQDFMFACSMYPGTDKFLDNVRHEAVDNVIRLRNHPSVVLWCGNNEINTMWSYYSDRDPLGWKALLNEENQEKVNKTYNDIFHHILPDVVEEYGGGIDYWPSSPQAGFDVGKHAHEQTLNSGDQHYWGVWHGLHPFAGFEKNVGRFMSEFGFQSFPEFETVKKYTIPSDWDIESDVMTAHQRSGIGNLRIKEYMSWYYNVPHDFEQFLYMSQVLQAEGVKKGIEAHRRNMPRCMGSLYWQLNDCWPVASWAGTDFYRNWKALHYAVRKAFEPVIISVTEVEDQYGVFVISDHTEDINATLNIRFISFDGSVEASIDKQVRVVGGTSTNMMTVSSNDFPNHLNDNEISMSITLVHENKILADYLYFFVNPKDLILKEPAISLRVEHCESGPVVELSSNTLVRDLMLYVPGTDIHFSNNYFDVLPGMTYRVQTETTMHADALTGKIKMRHLMM